MVMLMAAKPPSPFPQPQRQQQQQQYSSKLTPKSKNMNFSLQATRLLVGLGLVARLQAQEADYHGLPVPNYTETYSGSEYAYVPNRLNRGAAQAACAASGGALVSINSDYENEVVIQLIGGELAPVWLGLIRNDGNYKDKADGKDVFDWEDGSDTRGNSAWANGEPNNRSGGEDCGVYWGYLGGWNDALCSGEWSFVCERKEPTNVDLFPCCREELFDGVPRACYVDETCLDTPPGISGGLGCNADGTANCRFCGWGVYAGKIECPHGGSPPPTPPPAPTPPPQVHTPPPTPPPHPHTVDCTTLGWPGSCGAFTDAASCNCWTKSTFGCSWSYGSCNSYH